MIMRKISEDMFDEGDFVRVEGFDERVLLFSKMPRDPWEFLVRHGKTITLLEVSRNRIYVNPDGSLKLSHISGKRDYSPIDAGYEPLNQSLIMQNGRKN